ncbi:MAG: peptidylprolyl isomerase [Planctomycetota bacterium]
MTQHKAPTAVTIAPIHEKSGLALWVEQYWKVAAVLVVCLAALILFRSRAKHAERTETDTYWSKLLAVAEEQTNAGEIEGNPEEMRRVAGELKGNPTGAWALLIGATTAFSDRKLDEAEALLMELRASYPTHALVTQAFRDQEGSEAVTVVARLSSRIQAERAFVRDHPGLFDNPPLPADAPRVRLTTDLGPIVIGLYGDLAPKHVENFLKLTREDYYIGTKFHSVSQGEYVQGGDPNSIDKDPSLWGLGGPEQALDLEPSPLRHFAGVLSAVPAPGDPSKTSGSQFSITTASAHGLDRTHVPFGRVIEGLEILKRIEEAPLAEGSFSRPATPVAITATEVL